MNENEISIDHNLMEVDELQDSIKEKPVIGNLNDGFKHFEKLLEKTENFARCLSAGGIDPAQQGFIYFVLFCFLSICFRFK